MRVHAVETFPVGLPFREPYIAANGTLEAREMLLLRLSSGDLEGWGDAVPLSLRGGADMARVASDLELTCAPILIDVELDQIRPPAEAGAAIRSVLADCTAAGASFPAVAAVDIALLDLLGKSYGLPAWALLGAARSEPVACNGTVGAGPSAAVAADAAELVAQGFTAIKVKVGTGEDRERLEAVRAACGERVALRIDANGAWDLQRAVAELEGLASVGLELAEQPCAEVEDLAALREFSETPIVADESVATAEDARRAGELGACDAATLKLAKVGGPHAAIALAELVPSYLSSALDSPLGIAAALHTAQALPARGFAAGRPHGLSTSDLFADNVASVDTLSGPQIAVPAGSGLGVEVDEPAIERLRIEVPA